MSCLSHGCLGLCPSHRKGGPLPSFPTSIPGALPGTCGRWWMGSRGTERLSLLLKSKCTGSHGAVLDQSSGHRYPTRRSSLTDTALGSCLSRWTQSPPYPRPLLYTSVSSTHVSGCRLFFFFCFSSVVSVCETF